MRRVPNLYGTLGLLLALSATTAVAQPPTQTPTDTTTASPTFTPTATPTATFTPRLRPGEGRVSGVTGVQTAIDSLERRGCEGLSLKACAVLRDLLKLFSQSGAPPTPTATLSPPDPAQPTVTPTATPMFL